MCCVDRLKRQPKAAAHLTRLPPLDTDDLAGRKARRSLFDLQFSLQQHSAPKADCAFDGPVDGHRTNQVGGRQVRPAGPANNIFPQN